MTMARKIRIIEFNDDDGEEDDDDDDGEVEADGGGHLPDGLHEVLVDDELPLGADGEEAGLRATVPKVRAWGGTRNFPIFKSPHLRLQ